MKWQEKSFPGEPLQPYALPDDERRAPRPPGAVTPASAPVPGEAYDDAPALPAQNPAADD
jgi:hypothetical protein